MLINAFSYAKIYLKNLFILGVVKRNSLFLHEIEWKNNGFLFTTPNILQKYHISIKKIYS